MEMNTVDIFADDLLFEPDVPVKSQAQQPSIVSSRRKEETESRKGDKNRGRSRIDEGRKARKHDIQDQKEEENDSKGGGGNRSCDNPEQARSHGGRQRTGRISYDHGRHNPEQARSHGGRHRGGRISYDHGRHNPEQARSHGGRQRRGRISYDHGRPGPSVSQDYRDRNSREKLGGRGLFSNNRYFDDSLLLTYSNNQSVRMGGKVEESDLFNERNLVNFFLSLRRK